MRFHTRNNDGQFKKITATGLLSLLLLTTLPGCIARHMPDWDRVQDVPMDTPTEIQLYKEEADPESRKIKGRLLSTTDVSVTLRLKDGQQIQTFQRRSIRKMLAQRELGKRWPGWAALGISLGLCSGFLSSDFTPAAQVLFGVVVPVSISAAFFYGSRMGGIYEVPPNHRDWYPQETDSPSAGGKSKNSK